MKNFEDIPFFELDAPKTREELPSNPYKIQAKIFQSVGSIYRMRMNTPYDQPIDSVWIIDQEESRKILNNDEGIYIKGPQTRLPFHSLVPKHLIGLEFEESKLMRSIAQKYLNEQFSSTRLIKIVDKVSNRFIDIIKSKQTSHWIIENVANNNGNDVIITGIDRKFRAIALDIISETLFGKGNGWNALDDYSEKGNIKAFSLGEMMYELHWRVVDFNKRDWKKGIHSPRIQKIINTLEGYIEDQIDNRMKDHASVFNIKDMYENDDPEQDMLNQFLYEMICSKKIDREQVRNLCMTFLSMGHENVASGVSHTFVQIIQQPQSLQDELVKEMSPLLSSNDAKNLYQDSQAIAKYTKKLINCFEEAVRLYPSVPSLTRLNTVDTNILGYHIPKSTEVIVNMYVMHRSKEIYGKDAEIFKPTRCPVISTEGPPKAFPFGVGDRACIGRVLSYLEVRVIISKLLLNFKIESLMDKPNEPINLVSLRAGETKLLFKQRPSIAKAKL